MDLTAVDAEIGQSLIDFAKENPELALEIVDEVLGLGPIEPLLKDDSVSDILVNSQGNFSTTCQKAAASDPYCSGIQTGGGSGDSPVLSFSVLLTCRLQSTWLPAAI